MSTCNEKINKTKSVREFCNKIIKPHSYCISAESKNGICFIHGHLERANNFRKITVSDCPRKIMSHDGILDRKNFSPRNFHDPLRYKKNFRIVDRMIIKTSRKLSPSCKLRSS